MTGSDAPNRRWGTLAIAVLAVLAGTAAIAWHFAKEDLHQYLVLDTLQPISELLKQNQALVARLQSEQSIESESMILSTYLQRIRSDGVPKNAALKSSVDQLVTNNLTIETLLSRYTAHAQTAQFRVAAAQYADYTGVLRDRWQSVFEIFMAGGNLPAHNPVMPLELGAAIEREIAAR